MDGSGVQGDGDTTFVVKMMMNGLPKSHAIMPEEELGHFTGEISLHLATAKSDNSYQVRERDKPTTTPRSQSRKSSRKRLLTEHLKAQRWHALG